ncbi:hypothetical protein [Catellatospora vulcania]|uniref:hypothetical protein n=1 Tax=Catellatospora vulcania TaxID=1460450 RepID=UPI0012D471D6|nr:hypothetical protein [Catellatospora vulcania]
MHPAASKIYRSTALVLAVAGLIALALAAGASPSGGAGAVGWILGFFLLVVSMIYIAVHAVASLLYDHEVWRRKMDAPAAPDDNA